MLEDGSFEQADAVIACSGYNVNVDFFETDLLNLLAYDKLDNKCPFMTYKCTFHPEAENLGIMGLVDGLFFTCFELQAKWISLVFSGKKSLPSKENMRKEIELLASNRQVNMQMQYLFDYVLLIDIFLAEIGCLHNFDEMKSNEPELYRMLWGNCILSAEMLLNTDQHENAINLIKKVDYLTKKCYTFDDNVENKQESILKIGQVFGKENMGNYRAPLSIFKT